MIEICCVACTGNNENIIDQIYIIKVLDSGNFSNELDLPVTFDIGFGADVTRWGFGSGFPGGVLGVPGVVIALKLLWFISVTSWGISVIFTFLTVISTGTSTSPFYLRVVSFVVHEWRVRAFVSSFTVRGFNLAIRSLDTRVCFWERKLVLDDIFSNLLLFYRV